MILICVKELKKENVLTSQKKWQTGNVCGKCEDFDKANAQKKRFGVHASAGKFE